MSIPNEINPKVHPGSREAQREFIPACEGQLFSFKADTDMWTEWHYHPEIDILLILKNTGYHTTGDFMGELRPGTLVLNGSNVPHAFQPNEPDDHDPANPAMLVLQFSEETLGRDFLSRLELKPLRDFLDSTGRSFEFFGETRARAEALIRGLPGLSGAKRVAQFILILDCLASAPESERQPLVSPIYAPTLSKENAKRIDRVKQWIVANLEGDTCLDDIAAHIGMSPKSFSRFFRKNTGKTFIQYVNELRIGLACRLLAQSDSRVSEICYASGFQNLSNFNRRFMDSKGLSPQEFRKRYRANLVRGGS